MSRTESMLALVLELLNGRPRPAVLPDRPAGFTRMDEMRIIRTIVPHAMEASSDAIRTHVINTLDPRQFDRGLRAMITDTQRRCREQPSQRQPMDQDSHESPPDDRLRPMPDRPGGRRL